MSGVRTGHSVLSLRILLGGCNFIHCREANAGTKHFTGVGVSKLVPDDAGGNSSFGGDILQSRAEFAERYMDDPSVGTERVQAIDRPIDTFADAHAGVTEQKESITCEIVAAVRFLPDALILLGSHGARKMVVPPWNIVAPEQMRKSGELLGPSQFFQHTAQADDSSNHGIPGQPAHPNRH